VIEVRLRDGRSCREIAREIGVSHTTVAREVRRNACPDGRYRAPRAQRRAEASARRPRPRRVDTSPRLRAYVVRGLALLWSPRQISARMASEFPGDPEMRLSHEAIYQALYVQGRGSLRQELRVEQALRSGRRARRPRSALPPRSGAKTWVEGCEISLRPAEAADRAVPGHWEGDLVVGPGAACLVTLVERRTRYLEARRLDARDSRTVVDLLVEMVAAVPDGIRSALLSTLTWDQGPELAQAARFTEATGFRVYFCDPRSPWQRGTNENTNGLLRQYFPKGTDFSLVTDAEVRLAQDQLNGRPRETLGWRTPAEALAEELAKAGGALIA
jgi:IS30 family transposase